MFDRITYISDKGADVKLKDGEEVAINLMNLHLIFEDKDKKVLGEVDDMDGNIVKARVLGEISNGRLIGGVIRKPSLDASIRVIEQSEVPMIVGEAKEGYMPLGVSPFYNDYPVYLNVNNFFSNHFAILGNSGAGKSCGVSRLIQNMFQDKGLYPYKSNMFFFDSSAEYYNAFKDLSSIDPNFNYKFITTNPTEATDFLLKIPVNLLTLDDVALLLQASTHSQLPILERSIKYAKIFASESEEVIKYKNHLIAKAIMSILYTNQTASSKRNDVFAILATCSTNEFNMESPVQGIGNNG